MGGNSENALNKIPRDSSWRIQIVRSNQQPKTPKYSIHNDIIQSSKSSYFWSWNERIFGIFFFIHDFMYPLVCLYVHMQASGQHYPQSCQWFHVISLIDSCWQWRAKKCSNVPTKAVKKKSASYSWMQIMYFKILFALQMIYKEGNVFQLAC